MDGLTYVGIRAYAENKEEYEEMVQAWEALQSVPSYVERYQDAKEQPCDLAAREEDFA